MLLQFVSQVANQHSSLEGYDTDMWCCVCQIVQFVDHVGPGKDEFEYITNNFLQTLLFNALKCKSIEVAGGKCYAQGCQSNKREYCFCEHWMSANIG